MESEPSRPQFNPTVVALIAAVIVVMYGWPRWLIAVFGEESPWTNYLYHYGFGIIFFATGIFVIMKEGSLQLRRVRDVRWLRVLVGGLIGYMTVHLVWILLALRMPFLGD